LIEETLQYVNGGAKSGSTQELPDFSWHNLPKWIKIYKITTKLPNGHKICIPKGLKILRMAIKFNNIFFFNTL
jgi:hypothetical protein